MVSTKHRETYKKQKKRKGRNSSTGCGKVAHKIFLQVFQQSLRISKLNFTRI